jgi:hypothetical protein
MNNPYEIDMDADEIVYNDKKRKYSDIEQILKKQISAKKIKYRHTHGFCTNSRKRMLGL